jgi:hypothetical protein
MSDLRVTLAAWAIALAHNLSSRKSYRIKPSANDRTPQPRPLASCLPPRLSLTCIRLQSQFEANSPQPNGHFGA